MKQLQDLTRRYPLLIGVLSLVYTWCAVNYVPELGEGPWGWTFKELVIAAATVVLAVLFVRPSVFRFTFKGWRYAFKRSIYFIIVGIGLIGVIAITMIAMTVIKDPDPGKLSALAASLLLCITVGLFEELNFRVFLYGGLLAKLGRTTGGMIAAAAISSLIFGFVHVANAAFAPGITPDLAIQIAGKTIETGIFGFFLCAIYTKTHNFFYIAVLHSINDFLPLCQVNIQDSDLTYATGSSIGTYVYIFMVIIVIPVAVTSVKIFRTIPAPQSGPLMDDDFLPVAPEE